MAVLRESSTVYFTGSVIHRGCGLFGRLHNTAWIWDHLTAVGLPAKLEHNESRQPHRCFLSKATNCLCLPIESPAEELVKERQKRLHYFLDIFSADLVPSSLIQL